MSEQPSPHETTAAASGDTDLPSTTGEPGVDAALAHLDELLRERPVSEHVGAYETTHTALDSALAGDDD